MLMSAVGLITLDSWRRAAPQKLSPTQAGSARLWNVLPDAGGYGGAGGANRPPPAVTLVSTGTVTVYADGYAPVTLTCHRPVPCRGVLLLEGGRSDLLVNGGATRTIAVPLAPSTIASLRSHGPTTLNLTIDAANYQRRKNLGRR